jgi:hypothetical protein
MLDFRHAQTVTGSSQPELKLICQRPMKKRRREALKVTR